MALDITSARCRRRYVLPQTRSRTATRRSERLEVARRAGRAESHAMGEVAHAPVRGARSGRRRTQTKLIAHRPDQALANRFRRARCLTVASAPWPSGEHDATLAVRVAATTFADCGARTVRRCCSTPTWSSSTAATLPRVSVTARAYATTTSTDRHDADIARAAVTTPTLCPSKTTASRLLSIRSKGAHHE